MSRRHPLQSLAIKNEEWHCSSSIIGIEEENIPVLAAFDACHTHPMPIGRNVVLDATNKRVDLTEKWIG